MGKVVRDVFGVKCKRIPECLLLPLPMQNGDLEELRKRLRVQYLEECSGRKGGLARMLSADEMSSLADVPLVLSPVKRSDGCETPPVESRDERGEKKSEKDDVIVVMERDDGRTQNEDTCKQDSLPSVHSVAQMARTKDTPIEEQEGPEHKGDAEVGSPAESVNEEGMEEPSLDGGLEDEVLDLSEPAVQQSAELEADLSSQQDDGDRSSCEEEVIVEEDRCLDVIDVRQQEEKSEHLHEPAEINEDPLAPMEENAHQKGSSEALSASNDTSDVIDVLTATSKLDETLNRLSQNGEEEREDAGREEPKTSAPHSSTDCTAAEKAEKEGTLANPPGDASLKKTQAQSQHVEQLVELLKAYPPGKNDAASLPLSQWREKDVQQLTELAQLLKQNVEQICDQPPTTDEIHEFAKYLGMDVEKDRELLYIAEWAMTAPLPADWSVHLDSAGNEYFYNSKTKTSQYEHPMDQTYRDLYQRLKRL